MYEPSSDFKQLKVTWKFSLPGEAPRTILHHDASGDHIFLAAFRDRVNVAKKPPGDVSLHIKELEMTDIGSFVCLVELEAQNMSRISREKTVQLKVVKGNQAVWLQGILRPSRKNPQGFLLHFIALPFDLVLSFLVCSFSRTLKLRAEFR